MSLEILNNPLLRNDINSFLGDGTQNLSDSSFPVLQSPSVFKQLTSKQIANTHYNGKPVAEGKGFKIYSDEPVFGGNIEEIVFYKSRFSQTIGGIDVVLFASKNGAFLLQRYMEAIPQSNELILFLEIDSEYNYNTVLRAVAGADLTHKKDVPFADILTFARKHEITVAPDNLKALIQKGIYRNKVSFVSWFLGLKDASVGKIFNFFKLELLKEASNFFDGIGVGIAGLKIAENGWNPYPQEREYDPAFIPDILYKELKKFYDHTVSKNPYENLDGQKNVNRKIVNTLFEKMDGVKLHFKNLLNAGESFFPDFIFKKMKQVLNLFFGQIDKMKKYLADPLTGMQHAIYRGHTIANAFICGIYNSLVDVIAGIFSIIGFIFKAVAAMENVGENKVTYGEMFLELMEDLMEGIMKFDYAGFFYQCITFQMKTITRLVKWIEEKVPGFTLEQAAYYYGYIIGIVADIIVETLLTGGTAAVAKLAKTVESFMLKPLEKIAQAIEKTVTFTKDLLTRILEFIQMLLREFKKGVKELFAKLESFLDEIFGFGEKVADNALTPAEKRWKEKQRKIQEKLERKKTLINKTIDGNPQPSYEKGFEYYDARTPKSSEIPINYRRQARLLIHKIDKEIANLLDVNNTSGLSKGKKILLNKKGIKYIQESWLKDRQLIAGIIHKEKKLGEIIINKTNFPKGELNDFIKLKGIGRGESNLSEIKEIYKFYKQQGHIDFDMHPYIGELLDRHFYEISKGIKHPSSYNWERTGGLPGTHAEVLALNDLLWTLESKGVELNNEVLKGFIGYNKNLLDKEYMIRCGDCQLILKDVVFLEKITKFK